MRNIVPYSLLCCFGLNKEISSREVVGFENSDGGAHGKGKRGGCRVIYYWDKQDTIYMLFLYPKSKQEDLTPAQIKRLGKLVREEFK